MINLQKILRKEDGSGMAGRALPLLPLRDIVVFPHMVAPLFVGRAKSVEALTSAMNHEKAVFLSTQRKANIDNPRARDINPVGTIGSVLQLLRLPDGTVKALVEGKARGRIVNFLENEKFFQVEVAALPEIGETDAEVVALGRAVVEGFEAYAKVNKNVSKELVGNISAIGDPSQLADTVAAHFSFNIEEKQKLLEAVSIKSRLEHLLNLVRMEIEVFQVDQRIKGRVKDQMEKTQKNYYLNEQMRAIRKEMGARRTPPRRLQRAGEADRRKRMSKEARDKAWAEFKKLKQMTPMSAEATVVRNYIDWIVSLPWTERSRVNSRHRQGRKDSRRGSFRPGKAQGADPGIPGGADPGQEDPGSDPLSGGPAGRGEDLHRAVGGPGHGPEVRPALPGRRPGRGRNPRASPHLYRRHARQDHPVPAEGQRSTTRSSAWTKWTR
jgi:ATP-dependent Lon protease